METVRLNNGVEMPILGYGVYQVTPEECERCVLDAISVGYRSIDTAQAYYNEEGVGNAVRKCGVPREELFITTKVWISNGGYEKQKFLLTNPCVSSKVIMLICCLFISLSMITMVHTVPWKRLTRTEKLVPLASAISIRIVLSTWRNFVRLNRR